MSTNNEPWADDKLGRKEQATDISRYIITRSKNRREAGLDRGFVAAIQSGYGQGKSYFINNMKRDLAERHPVCLIDAWTDDRLNSPFLAILDGIENALEPFFDTDSKIKEKTAKMIKGSGRLLKGAALGAAKKAAEKAAGGGLGQLLEDVLDDEIDTEELEELDLSEIGSAGLKQGIERIEDLSDTITKKGLKEYRQRKLSMLKLRKRLTQLSGLIDQNNDLSLPVFVFIDELDRCRPDYAITLLEEVKHLFDIPGFVFVLSIQKEQLLNAIKAVYGNDFDANSYIDRFIDKYFALDTPSCLQFVELELTKEPLGDTVFLTDIAELSDAERVALVFDHYGLSLREMERALDILRATVVLLNGVKVDPIYLTQQITQHMELAKTGKSRSPFPSIEVEWREQRDSFTTTARTGKLDKLDSLLGSIRQYASWTTETVEQQLYHIKKPETYYAHQMIDQFFAQFEYSQGKAFTMSQVCHKVIQKIKPFDVQD